MAIHLCNLVGDGTTELQNWTFQNLAADPAAPNAGAFYFNTGTNRFRYFDGTVWQEAGTETITTFNVATAGQATYTSEDGTITTFNETDVVLTTDGTATGVALSGTSDHTVDVTLLSTVANNSLSTGADGGVYYDDPIDGVTDQVNGLDLTINASNIEVAYDFTELTAFTDIFIDANADRFIMYNASATAHESVDLVDMANALLSSDANNSLSLGGDQLLYFNALEQSVVADITARDALTDLQTGQIAWVIDASGDATVDAGAAMYVWNGAAWDKVSEFESLDVGLSVVTPQAQAGALAGRTIAIHDDSTGNTANVEESITTLVDNADGTFTHTSEDNTSTVITILRKVCSTVTTVAGVELNVTHNLNTTDVIYSVQDSTGNFVDMCVRTVDANNIGITTNQAQANLRVCVSG